MINRRMAIAVLAVTLAACGDGGKEDDEVNNQKLFQKALRQDSPRISKTPELNARPQKQESTEKDLSQMEMDETMTDQASDIEELEEYRQDYEAASDMEEKSEALIALVQADEKNAITLLQEAYDSPEPELRREAVLQLQDFSEDARAVELMLKALDDSDSEVVINAIEGLSGQDSGRVMEKLKKVAQSHSDESVRAAAQDYLDQANEPGQ